MVWGTGYDAEEGEERGLDLDVRGIRAREDPLNKLLDSIRLSELNDLVSLRCEGPRVEGVYGRDYLVVRGALKLSED